jgi:uncharacterized protein YndB with AHSA1/START domain
MAGMAERPSSQTFEISKGVEAAATPEQAWEAVATGPGLDSWFMGRNEIEPREGGVASWSIGDFTLRGTVTAWDPPGHFQFRTEEGTDGAFHQFDYRIEPKDGGRTGVRYTHSGRLTGDWEAEYEAMGEGDPAYIFKLQQYLTHFLGRSGVSIDAYGPNVPDEQRVMAAYRHALGLGDEVSVGDAVQAPPLEGIGPIEGVVDFLSPHFIGVLTDDAIYRFIHGFEGTTFAGHHLFAPGVDQAAAEATWSAWLQRVFGGGPEGATG